MEEFERLARYRAEGHRAYRDGGEEWQATPAALRSMVDRYNGMAPQVRAGILNRFATSAEHSHTLEQHLEQRREQIRGLDRGFEL